MGGGGVRQNHQNVPALFVPEVVVDARVFEQSTHEGKVRLPVLDDELAWIV